jgi:hypothetical protein
MMVPALCGPKKGGKDLEMWKRLNAKEGDGIKALLRKGPGKTGREMGFTAQIIKRPKASA